MSGVAPDAGAQGDFAAAPSRPGGMSLAERMMKNMGWKEVRGSPATLPHRRLTLCPDSVLLRTYPPSATLERKGTLLLQTPAWLCLDECAEGASLTPFFVVPRRAKGWGRMGRASRRRS